MSHPLIPSIDTRAANRPWWVGFSGGLDSTVLLHALATLRPGQVRALHVHHALHADADDWAKHCERMCAALGVPLSVMPVSVETSDEGPEAAARNARHAAYQAALGEDEVIALAHHRDDQAETFLLRALRGSGPDGLAAMRPWRQFEHGWLWRPLLDQPREALRAYAMAHALQWIDDPSNQSSRFDRNFLRNEVMPLLRTRWPKADDAFARAARLQQQASEALQAGDRIDFDVASSPLPLEHLRALSPVQRARAFRAWAAHHALPSVPARAVDWLESELAKPPGDGASECDWANTRLRRWRDALYLDERQAPLPADLDITWDGRSGLVLPTGLQWMLEGATGFEMPLRVTARRGGERIQLAQRRHRHLLKQVLQDEGIPPWQRDAIPLLFGADGELLAAGNIHSAALTAWLREHDAELLLSNPGRD